MPLKLIASAAILATMLTGSALAQEAVAAKQEVNEALRARLPADILKAGTMVSVTNGSFPPYEIVSANGMTGASADLSDAIGELLGIEITHATVGGLPAT